MSTPAHTMLSVQQFLTKNIITAVPHLSYSPNFAQLSNFFFLFPQMKKGLKAKHFANVEEVKQKMAEALKGIKIDEFKNYFEQRKKVLICVLHQIESTLKVNQV